MDSGAVMARQAKGAQITRQVFGELKSWWITSIYSYHGQSAYIPLFILTILMFVPVMTVFLCLTVLLSYGRYLFFAVAADAIWYLLRAILGKNFIAQAAGRYFRVFPEAGRRHEERVYDRNLRKQNREFERMEKDKKRERASSFYEEEGEDEDRFYDGYGRGYDRNNSDYDARGGRYDRHDSQKAYRGYEEDYAPEFDEDYDPEFEEEYGRGGKHNYDDEYDPEYNDQDYDGDYGPEYDEEYGDEDQDYDDYGEDEDYEDFEDEYSREYDEDFEDDYDDPRSRRSNRREQDTAGKAASSTFDFFAGCSSRESVDKKYKSLVKLYHPDNMDGDTAALQEINAQYAEAKKRFG